MSKFLFKNKNFLVIYQPFELKIQPKAGLFRSKTMPKYFLNDSQTTLKEYRNRFFRLPKWSEMTPSSQNEQIFWRKLFIFGVSFQTLELKIRPTFGILRSKTTPKLFLHNSKTTSKKSIKRLFQPPNWPNHGCQTGKKCRFLSPFSIYEL